MLCCSVSCRSVLPGGRGSRTPVPGAGMLSRRMRPATGYMGGVESAVTSSCHAGARRIANTPSTQLVGTWKPP